MMSETDQAVIDLDGRSGDRVGGGGFETRDKYQCADPPTSPPQMSARDRMSSVGSLASSRVRPTAQLEVKLPWYKSVTWKDIRDILPTLVILFVGLLIMVLVIPYAFSSVIKQLQQEQINNRLREEGERNRTEKAAALNPE